jgi:hypothetical protein
VRVVLLFLLVLPLIAQSQDDEAICRSVFALANERGWSTLPIGDIVVEVGKTFLGAPYEPHTLEQPGDERLVVNLRTFDCVTFVESVLALARCIKSNTPTFDAFATELLRIRYRGGVLDGYASRLHYFSEWMEDAEAKDIAARSTARLDGKSFEKTINWMTTHHNSYPRLSDAAVHAAMETIERRLSKRDLRYIPGNHVGNADIRNGDIVGIMTNLSGLDISHTGIAVRTAAGEVRYMHAPNVKGSVNITPIPLGTYVAKNKSAIGIMISRPIESRKEDDK